jgi:hypothetical protein
MTTSAERRSEVLDRQPEAVWRLLLRTSILDRVNGELADVLTSGSGGTVCCRTWNRRTRSWCRWMARSWFRYHQMFAGLLELARPRDADARPAFEAAERLAERLKAANVTDPQARVMQARAMRLSILVRLGDTKRARHALKPRTSSGTGSWFQSYQPAYGPAARKRRLRVSHRAEQRLAPGQIVPVDIAFYGSLGQRNIYAERTSPGAIGCRNVTTFGLAYIARLSFR